MPYTALARMAGHVLAIALCCGSAGRAASNARWEALHSAMRSPLGAAAAQALDETAPVDVACAAHATSGGGSLRAIVVGFAGGIEGPHSKASGVVQATRPLLDPTCRQAGVLAVVYSNLRWRRAAQDVIRIAREERTVRDPQLPQPVIIILGHSWGAGAMHGFAHRLERGGLEVTLAVYLDAFSWRDPRVPRNVRYAVNYYQRAGIFRGLPFRGKSNLYADDPATTTILGSYRLKPAAYAGPSLLWLPERLVCKQHHLIAHDARVQRFLQAAVNLELELLRNIEIQSARAGEPQIAQ